MARDSIYLPRLGWLRHVGVNRKSLFQDSIELVLTMSLNKVVSLEEHCCLADFGIRFSTLTFGICASAGDGGDGNAGDPGGGKAGDVGAAAGDGGVDDGKAETGNAGNGAGGLGGLPHPGHLDVTGPWVLNRLLAVMNKDLKQTAHALDLINFTLVVIEKDASGDRRWL